ncbi:DUF4402 domain-containing protein [Mucilaginibacter sp.]|uniref:DUF4402 domain-containing protein n=1 Tax=Mucilaginibacter sp. TaxID=1882438 RepID=UPI0025F5412F|nr:DUF4402 domain-containing protein [Mucilaginibacter sp.]
MKAHTIYILRRKVVRMTFSLLLFMLANAALYAQRKSVVPEKPPRPITIYVNPAQGLSFGAFVQGGSGGTVIIYANGSRSVTGSVIQANLGFSFSPAIFEVDAEPGTLVTIVNGPDISLTGSNGGSMNMHIGASSLGSPFIATAVSPSRTQLRIGGTLTVGSPLANPPGNYNGTFSVTFIQQ